ncbi:MAG TPA: hypothetical protein VGE57_14495 [Solimonas sp.]
MNTYDEVSLCDLSHTLRIWADLKSHLSSVPVFSSSVAFKTGIPPKKVRKAARGHRHVFAFMPGGVVTRANQGQIAGSSEPDDDRGDLHMAVWFKQNNDGSAELKNFSFVAAAVSDDLARAMRSEEITRCNYIQWLGAEVARIAYKNEAGALTAVSISREQMIRRVANTMDGSHPSTGATPSSNRFDEPIRKLLNYQLGGLPLPYFILLKVAQDIVALGDRILSRMPATPSA